MKRAKHNLSNYKLATCNMGQLIPCGLVEVVRGDSIQQHTSALVRVAPMLAPVMHPVHTKIHHWFVPNRLVWDDWENFITGGPQNVASWAAPTITLPATPTVGSLADYFGLPVGAALPADSRVVSALPFRGYAKIFNEFYRDQDLQTELVVSTASGVDTTTSTTLQNAAWQKDYFTTARPEPQKGPEITLPLGGSAPVYVDDALATQKYVGVENNGGVLKGLITEAGANPVYVQTSTVNPGPNQALPLLADLDDATAVSVNDVRLAMALQRFSEARARYGSRYSEFLAYYGIKSSDARLQRPEYLGGGRQTIQFSEVLSTTQNDDSDVGDMYGHGIGSVKSNRYRHFFEEDGFIISLCVTNPITMYTQGIPKMWTRLTKEDYFQKELQHIGQMQILNKEVYAPHATPNGTFGWQDRYDDYRRIENTISGEFRTTLNYWHYARIFASDPALNADFITSNPTNRVYASTDTNQLYIMIRHNIQARRLVAKYGKSFIY